MTVFFEATPTPPNSNTYVLNMGYVLRIGVKYGRVFFTTGYALSKKLRYSMFSKLLESYVGLDKLFKPENVVTRSLTEV